MKAMVIHIFLWTGVQPGLSFDDAVGEPHLMTQGRWKNHQLDGVFITCSHHQLSLLILQQSSDYTDPCWEHRSSIGGDVPFASSFLLHTGQHPLVFFFFLPPWLWPALVGELKQLSICWSRPE